MFNATSKAFPYTGPRRLAISLGVSSIACWSTARASIHRWAATRRSSRPGRRGSGNGDFAPGSYYLWQLGALSSAPQLRASGRCCHCGCFRGIDTTDVVEPDRHDDRSPGPAGGGVTGQRWTLRGGRRDRVQPGAGSVRTARGPAPGRPRRGPHGRTLIASGAARRGGRATPRASVGPPGRPARTPAVRESTRRASDRSWGRTGTVPRSRPVRTLGRPPAGTHSRREPRRPADTAARASRPRASSSRGGTGSPE